MVRLKGTSFCLLGSLLVIHASLLGWGAYVNSPTIDEIEWLPSGVIHWNTGKLDIAVTRNPPHVGLAAAFPLLFAEMDTTAFRSIGSVRALLDVFFRRNGERTFWLFTLGRWACIPFSLLGLGVSFIWARDLYGPRSGILAAALWCFCPNVLAHGQIVSHDVAAASFGLAAAYLLWRWLTDSRLRNAVLAGVGLGLALCSKMTILVYVALWPAVWLCWSLTARDASDGRRPLLRNGAVLVGILVLALDVLNAAYAFQGTFDPLRSYEFRSNALGGTVNEPGNRFADSWLGRIPIPLPRAYVTGIDLQRVGLEGGWPVQHSYLRGEWRLRGWWYYYFYALAIKVPLGTWCLALLSAAYRIRGCDDAHRMRDEIVLLAPAVVVFFFASTSTVTDHLRYILPCFPLAFIWISRLASANWPKHRLLCVLAITALGWSMVSSLAVYPHSLSYFNEIVGGPKHGHYHLVSSNIDYGQDLLHLKRWCKRHPEARPLGISYNFFWPVDPSVAGIEYFVAPSGPAPDKPITESAATDIGPLPGWYAVNVNALRADKWPGRRAYPELFYYGYFLNFVPVYHAGYSILIYHITLGDANEVRKSLGMPLLDAAPEQRVE